MGLAVKLLQSLLDLHLKKGSYPQNLAFPLEVQLCNKALSLRLCTKNALSALI